MTGWFIAGAGTDVGKTLVTCALIRQARAQGKAVGALKPVVSGFTRAQAEASDTGRLLAALGLPLNEAELDKISPWRFAAPLAPDMAAARERKVISFAALVAFCQMQRADVRLVEGVGGVMAPLDARHHVLDWMTALGWPVLLVTGSYLGSISHTLTACEAVLARGLRLHAVIISESAISPVPLPELVATFARFLPPATRFHAIPRLASALECEEQLTDMTYLLHE